MELQDPVEHALNLVTKKNKNNCVGQPRPQEEKLTVWMRICSPKVGQVLMDCEGE